MITEKTKLPWADHPYYKKAESAEEVKEVQKPSDKPEEAPKQAAPEKPNSQG